ncbi:MAG: hypothetical protein LBR10_10225 [Prevotellaceae bacterium]|nr:hypothetical protein [Prevotellaceae bacterium]
MTLLFFVQINPDGRLNSVGVYCFLRHPAVLHNIALSVGFRLSKDLKKAR